MILGILFGKMTWELCIVSFDLPIIHSDIFKQLLFMNFLCPLQHALWNIKRKFLENVRNVNVSEDYKKIV